MPGPEDRPGSTTGAPSGGADRTPPPWTEPHLPPEAERMGLLPVTAPELVFASALRPDKRLHRVLAWLGLGAIALTGLSGLVGWLRAVGALG